MAIIGIDLGTTNSLVSVWSAKGSQLIKNPLDAELTPSVVGIDDDGTILIGQVAAERLITHNTLTVGDFKRLMGTDRPVTLGTQEFRPEELSSLVLRALKEDAENNLGCLIEEAIISVPAYFNDIQRKAVMHAGRLAGLKVERLVNEPTAAALAYGMNEVEEGQFLVFDLGGGTFDVSILEKYENVMEVRASAGDNYLGGNDFRDIIVSLIAQQHSFILSELEAQDYNHLQRVAEGLKIKLSTSHESHYQIHVANHAYEGKLSREAFEKASEGLLRTLRAPLERAISDATISPDEIENIVLVGGATRMPMIRKLVTRLFGKLPLCHLDPETLVGLGAAVQAGLKERNHALEDIVMTDVCPYTLGTDVLDHMSTTGHDMVMSPIIERNAIVPISRSHIYTTSYDGQDKVRISIFQGENLRPENNILLGSLDLEVPKGSAGEEEVEVRFTYDVNGALEVEAHSLSLNKVERKILSNDVALVESELEKRFLALQDIKLHPRERAENKALLARGERIYAESLGSKREYVLGLLQQFEARIADQRSRNLVQERVALAHLLDLMDRSVFDPEQF